MNAAISENNAGRPGEPETCRPSATRRLGWLGRLVAVLLLLGPAWALDMPLFNVSRPEHVRGMFPELADMAQLYGEPTGVTLVCLVVWALDRKQRRAVIVLVTAVLIAGGAAAGAKLLIGRQRPRVTQGRTVFQGPEWPASNRDDPGFPSGHTAVAFALSYSLFYLYPQGRVLFLAFAAACAASRVYGGLHFLTDVIAAAWLGWELARGVWSWGWFRALINLAEDCAWLPRWPVRIAAAGEENCLGTAEQANSAA